MAKIIVPEGTEDIPVGKPVAVLCEEQADIAAFKDYVPEASADAPPAAAAVARQSRARATRLPTHRRTSVTTLTTGLASKPLEDGAAALAPVLDADSPVMTVRDALNSALAEEMEHARRSSSWARRSATTRARTRSRRACCSASAPTA